MRWTLFLPLVFFQLHSFQFNETFEKHFAKIEVEDKPSGIEGIDCIYVINLDRHPERWEYISSNFESQDLSINRASAVDGRNIENKDRKHLLNWWHRGRLSNNIIGCYLSHVSIWKDAYTRGYSKIWVVEDDLQLLDNVKKISSLLLDLNTLDPNWDVLYADNIPCTPFLANKFRKNSFLYGKKSHLSNFYKDEVIDENFIKTKVRPGTWSMILSRSGIKKLLDDVSEQKIRLPVDYQIHLIDDLRKYSVVNSLVVHTELFGSSTSEK